MPAHPTRKTTINEGRKRYILISYYDGRKGLPLPNLQAFVRDGELIIFDRMKLTPGVRPTGYEGEPPILGKTLVGRIAVALHQATKACSQGMVQTVDRPTRMPALAEVRQLWPGVSFLASARCWKPDERLFDAALIAEYGLG